MYFFERPEIDISSKTEINLYLSITNYYLLSFTEINFKFDFTFPKTLINEKNFNCLKENYCKKSIETKTDKYKEKIYDYQEIETFIGLKKLSAAQIDEKTAKTVSVSKIRLIKNTELENVLGISPNSEFFTSLEKNFILKIPF